MLVYRKRKRRSGGGAQVIALTFAQFKDELATRWTRDGYEFDQSDIDSTATPMLWHSQNLLPFAQSGGEFSLAVCKSIVKHGYCSLEWFAKEFPKCLGESVDSKSGRRISKKDFRKSAQPDFNPIVYGGFSVAFILESTRNES
jgi:hypothetical protein